MKFREGKTRERLEDTTRGNIDAVFVIDRVGGPASMRSEDQTMKVVKFVIEKVLQPWKMLNLLLYTTMYISKKHWREGSLQQACIHGTSRNWHYQNGIGSDNISSKHHTRAKFNWKGLFKG